MAIIIIKCKIQIEQKILDIADLNLAKVREYCVFVGYLLLSIFWVCKKYGVWLHALIFV
jgi:hypothetical protein